MPRSNKRGASAPRQTHCIALTEQRDNHGTFKCYKIVVGSIDRDGKRVPKSFYLGDDRPRAEKLAIRIRDKWKATKASVVSAPVWTVADLAEIGLWLADQEAPMSDDERKGMNIHAVITKYVADERDRADKGQITVARCNVIEHSAKWIERFLPDIPMRILDEQWLVKLSRSIKQRYISDKTGLEISQATITHRLGDARQFLKWADKWGYWVAPRLFFTDGSLWSLTRHERNKFATSDTIRVLSMDELKALYDAVREPSRLGARPLAMFLLAMNCGFSHAEFATLTTSELTVDDDGTAWIKRKRRKSGVLGQWKLWPETVTAIESARAGDNEWGLVFLNQWGKPIYVSVNRGMASTLTWWQRLRRRNRDRPNFPRVGFKYLRKTASDLVRKLSDFNTAEAFLSHSEGKIARAYHNKDWEKLNAATDALRLALFAAFEPPKMRLAV